MKKRMFIFIVIMLLVVGGCNNQASQLTDQPNDDYPTNTDQIVQENNSNTTDQNVGNKQSGEVDGEEINNTQDDNSQNGNTASPSNKEDNTNKSTNVPEKQVWLDYFDGIDTMINISNYPNGKPNVLNKRNFSENFINDVDLLKELGKEYYSIIVTPSGEYLILWLPIDYTKYLDYDIESSVKKNNKNIDNFLDRYYDLGHNGKIYSVIYSLKQKKIIDLNEVENDSDKEYIYDWVLDNRYFYVSSLDTIKNVNGVIFRNYKEDKVVIEGIWDEKLFVIFYDLIKEKEEDKIEIDDFSIYSDVRISQWNDDGTVYITVTNAKNTSYKYDLHTKKLTKLAEFIYFPLLTEDKKYMFYNYDGIKTPEKTDGVYALNLETGTETLIYTPSRDAECKNLTMITTKNY